MATTGNSVRQSAKIQSQTQVTKDTTVQKRTFVRDGHCSKSANSSVPRG